MRVIDLFEHRTFQSENSEKSRHYRRFMDKTLTWGKSALPRYCLKPAAGVPGACAADSLKVAFCDFQRFFLFLAMAKNRL
jgi:hypothetical protein